MVLLGATRFVLLAQQHFRLQHGCTSLQHSSISVAACFWWSILATRLLQFCGEEIATLCGQESCKSWAPRVLQLCGNESATILPSQVATRLPPSVAPRLLHFVATRILQLCGNIVAAICDNTITTNLWCQDCYNFVVTRWLHFMVRSRLLQSGVTRLLTIWGNEIALNLG